MIWVGCQYWTDDGDQVDQPASRSWISNFWVLSYPAPAESAITCPPYLFSSFLTLHPCDVSPSKCSIEPPKQPRGTEYADSASPISVAVSMSLPASVSWRWTEPQVEPPSYPVLGAFGKWLVLTQEPDTLWLVIKSFWKKTNVMIRFAYMLICEIITRTKTPRAR